MSQVELNFDDQDPAPSNKASVETVPDVVPVPATATATATASASASASGTEMTTHAAPASAPAEIAQPASVQGRRLRNFMQSPYGQMFLSILMAAGLSLAMYLALPLCYRFWTFSLNELIAALPLESVQLSTLNLVWPAWQDLETPAIKLGLVTPDYHDWLGNLGGAILLYLLAGLLRPTVRATLRALAVFHLFGVLAQGFASQFPYDVEDHTRSLSVFTIGLLLCLPVVMAATHYIVERNHERRAIATILIAAWLILSLPPKLIAHAALLHLISPLAMPTLFMVFGPALDIMIVSALYAWVVTWRHGPG